MQNASEMLRGFRDAGYPAIAVETWEERRLIAELAAGWKDRTLLSIGAASPVIDERMRQPVTRGESSYGNALTEALKRKPGALVMMDFQHIIRNAGAYRQLLTAMDVAKATGVMFILAAPAWNLPDELRHHIPVIQMALPSSEEIAALIDPLAAAWDRSNPGNKVRRSAEREGELCSAALGLTTAEAENALALCLTDGTFRREVVEREKMRLVKSQCLSVERPVSEIEFAGYGQLKEYIATEVAPSKDDPDLRVRGILLVGVPGSGKSLACRVTASMLGWPLVRLDIAAAKGSLVGQTEANIRAAFRVIRAIGNCVVWIDEIEKGIGGYASSAQTDSGVTLGLVGALLTELAEQKDAIYVATANQFEKLPSELTRAGRFDERFFLDLPSVQERVSIAKIHLGRFGASAALAESAKTLCVDWTGAEIEQMIKSAARRTQRKITPESLSEAASKIVPIARYQNIEEMRKWAKGRLRPANDADASQFSGKLTATGVRWLQPTTKDLVD